ncbi:hypothetical protein FCM35_KLT09091 [Carex littledalei]|uniref:RRM domain-containing protein n=1 Tax=Carex littledalei TaxID=544730 RepID=A0A833QQA1_9POAL|nr:hypothetical protein FCM35_KLT09091 [Carex littledalei]
MLLQPTPIRPSLPLSRYPSPLSPPFLPLRSSLSLTPSAISARSRSHLNRRRQSDGSDDSAGNLDDEIEDDEEAFEERKPRGFVAGGLHYDTSLEETLLKEIGRSRKDQTVNLNKVKGKRESPKNKGLKKPQDKDSTTAPTLSATTSGICVRLWNLPKKRNIHRDLQTAFKGFRGILHINPAIAGNKKTRDPICKGFAFVDLATEEAATRFVETYSKRSISFGRVEKQISCCIVNPNANVNPNPTTNEFSNYRKAPILQPKLHDGFMGKSENNNPSDDSPIIFVEDDEEEEEDSLSSFEMMKFDDGEAEEDKLDSEITRLSSGERKKAVSLKRRRVRPRRANGSKLSVPVRLKGRERDVLTGVFSKYSTTSGATPTRKS